MKGYFRWTHNGLDTFFLLVVGVILLVLGEHHVPGFNWLLGGSLVWTAAGLFWSANKED